MVLASIYFLIALPAIFRTMNQNAVRHLVHVKRYLSVFSVGAITCKVLISDQDVVVLGFGEASFSSLRFGFSVNLGIEFMQG